MSLLDRTWTPKLLSCLRGGYKGRDLIADLIAGVTVGLVALPLAMAFGIAWGVWPQAGIYTAVNRVCQQQNGSAEKQCVEEKVQRNHVGGRGQEHRQVDS